MSVNIEWLQKVPPPLVGAPHPTVLASEHRVILLYYSAKNYEKAICVFDHCFEFRMGMPSADKINDFPLHKYGIDAWGAYLVNESPWVSELDQLYGVIREFSVEARNYKHYVFTFHDRSFECISSGLEIITLNDDHEYSAVIRELPILLGKEKPKDVRPSGHSV